MVSRIDTCKIVGVDLRTAIDHVAKAQRGRGYGYPPPSESVRDAVWLLNKSLRNLTKAYKL